MGSGGFPEPYAAFAHEVMTTMMAAAHGPVTTARDVAEAVYRAATDRLPDDASGWSGRRRMGRCNVTGHMAT